MAMKLGLN